MHTETANFSLQDEQWRRPLREAGAQNFASSFNDLDEVQATLHDSFVERGQDERFLVRYLGTQGEPGSRCLTLNLELQAEAFERVRADLDRVVSPVRQAGFVVDELLQRVTDESGLELRFWILIYE
jgi:hypothetical protein